MDLTANNAIDNLSNKSREDYLIYLRASNF